MKQLTATILAVLLAAPIFAQTTTDDHQKAKSGTAIGAAAGAIIGATTSRDKVKGGLIGAGVGGILGAIVGNNVDIQRRQIP